MKDRVSLYPGRIKLTPVEEKPNTYDLSRQDEPIEEGMPLNKASLFSDMAEKAIFDDVNNRTPSDGFKLLGSRSITPTRQVTAKATEDIKAGNLCEFQTGLVKNLPAPSSPPTNTTGKLAFQIFNGVLYMAVPQYNPPYISIFSLIDGEWIRITNPATLPTGTGNDVALAVHNNLLYMSVFHDVTPFVSTYQWNGSVWTRLTNPVTLPASSGQSGSLAVFNNMLYMAVGHEAAPFVTTYYLSGSIWTKIANPTTLPLSTVVDVDLHVHNNLLYMATAISGAVTIIRTYQLSGNLWTTLTDIPPPIGTSGYAVNLHTFNSELYLAISFGTAPFLRLFKRVGTAWEIFMEIPEGLIPGYSKNVTLLTFHGSLILYAVGSYAAQATLIRLTEIGWIASDTSTAGSGSGGSTAIVFSNSLFTGISKTTAPYISTQQWDNLFSILTKVSTAIQIGRAQKTVSANDELTCDMWTK